MSFTHNKGVDMPLTPLRAFVAVGQHGNFTRAAAALGVTQGAVSRHIATLETFAGGRLFHRRGATIEFTPSGLQLFDCLLYTSGTAPSCKIRRINSWPSSWSMAPARPFSATTFCLSAAPRI